MKYRDLSKALKEMGFSFSRQGKGNHEIWTNGTRTLTIPKKKDGHRGLSLTILRRASGAHK